MKISENSHKRTIDYLSKNGYDLTSNKNKPLERLIELWERFVGECEEGYSFGFEDYLNDLTVRDTIEELQSLLTATELKSLQAKLSKLDDRLRKLLINSEKSLWGDRVVNDNKWTKDKCFWNFGFPKNPKGEFKEDLTGSS